MSKDLVILAMAGRVAEVTLNRPGQMNALTPALLGELGACLDGIAARDDVSVVVLSGAGRAFSAGVDLKALQGDAAGGDVGGTLNARARHVIDRIESMPQAVIAKINGFCFTGALEIALACDLRIVAEEAKLGDTHAVLGFRPTWGMTQRLPRLVGAQRARELSYTARAFSGAEAAAYGLALEAVPLAELDARVAALAEQIAANSPGSIAAYKDLYRVAANSGLADGLAHESATEYDIPDTAARVAAFMAKRL
jgi:enoyl-CoA hydratase